MQEGKLTRKNLLIGVTLTVILILSAGVYTGYAMFDWFKDPKTIYLQSEFKQMQQLTTRLSETNAEYQELVHPYLDKPVHTTTELSNLTLDADHSNPELDKVLELIKDAKLQLDVHMDDKNKKAVNKAKLMLKDRDVLSLELFTDQNKLGFSVPDVYGKYAVIDLKDADKAKEDYDFLESLPSRVISYDDWVNAVRITPEEIKPILIEYGKLYADRIDPKQVTINKDAVFEEDGVKLESREITVTFTESELKQLILAVSEKLSNDKALHEILFTRYQNVIKLLKDSGYGDEIDEISKETFTEQLKDAHFDLKDSLHEVRLNEDVTMVVHIDRKGNILSRTVSLNVSSDDVKGRNAVVFKTGSWTDKDTSSGILSLRTRSDQGDGGEVKISYSNEEKGEENKGKVDVVFKETENDKSNTALSFHTDFTLKGTEKQKDGEFSFKASFQDEGTDEELSGSVNTTVTQTDSGKNAEYRMKMNVGKLQESDGLKSISLKITNKEQYGQEVQLPVLTAENSFDLVQMTDADKTKLQQDVMKGIEQYTQKNADLLQAYFPYAHVPDSFVPSAPSSAPRPAAQKGETVEPAPGVEITKYTITSLQPKETISYPEIRGLNNASVQKEINESLKAIAIPEPYDSEMEGMFEYEYTADYEVKYVEGSILNIMFTTYTYAGGAHGMPYQFSYIVNVETGQTYQLSDLFDKSSHYTEQVSDIIMSLDAAQAEEPLDSFESIADDEGFYLEENGIVVYFEPYQYKSYAAGFPEYQIAYDELDSVINKEGGLWKAMGR